MGQNSLFLRQRTPATALVFYNLPEIFSITFFRSTAFANIIVVLRMGNCCCYVVGPDEAMVITGGCFSDAKRQIIGGFGCACPCWSDVTVLPLNIMTLVRSVQQCETKQGRLLLSLQA